MGGCIFPVDAPMKPQQMLFFSKATCGHGCFTDVSRLRIELSKKAFKYEAPSSSNYVKKDLNLSELITVGQFKSLLTD